MPSKPIVIIDIERMKYAHVGLYTFCNQLINSLDDTFDYRYLGKFANLDRTQQQRFHKPSFIQPRQLDKLFGIKNVQADVWHATHQDTQYLPASNIPLVLTIHDLNFLYTNKSIQKKRTKLKKIQQLIDRASALVVISNYVLNDVKQHLQLNDLPVHVIYNGVDKPSINAVKNPPIETHFLFALGTLLPKKNFHVLLPLLINNDYQLLIAGIQPDKDYLQYLKEYARTLGVESRLKILGAISEQEKHYYYQQCSAFLFPSLSEGFGLPVIEAMSYGKPVFCSNLTSLPEVAGEEAYFFESFDAKHMSKVFNQGMYAYQTDKTKQDRIIAWSQQFTWEKTAQAYTDVYTQVLQQTRSLNH